MKKVIFGAFLLMLASCAPQTKFFESTSFRVETDSMETPVLRGKHTIIEDGERKLIVTSKNDTIDCSSRNHFYFKTDSVVRVDHFGYITIYYK